jgi:hypothetical protein
MLERIGVLRTPARQSCSCCSKRDMVRIGVISTPPGAVKGGGEPPHAAKNKLVMKAKRRARMDRA